MRTHKEIKDARVHYTVTINNTPTNTTTTKQQSHGGHIEGTTNTRVTPGALFVVAPKPNSVPKIQHHTTPDNTPPHTSILKENTDQYYASPQ